MFLHQQKRRGGGGLKISSNKNYYYCYLKKKKNLKDLKDPEKRLGRAAQINEQDKKTKAVASVN